MPARIGSGMGIITFFSYICGPIYRTLFNLLVSVSVSMHIIWLCTWRSLYKTYWFLISENHKSSLYCFFHIWILSFSIKCFIRLTQHIVSNKVFQLSFILSFYNWCSLVEIWAKDIYKVWDDGSPRWCPPLFF